MASSAAEGAKPGRLVRPFMITGTLPTREDAWPLDVVTTVVTVGRGAGQDDLRPEREMIRWLCTRPRSIAELADELDLPLSVVRLLVQDLLRAGELQVGESPPRPQRLDGDVLRTVREGLRAL